MFRSILAALALAVLPAALSAQAPSPSPSQSASIHQAAAFYHEGRFDSALARLEALKTQGPWKRRDSLSLYQYLGMASARLGHGDEATGYFSELLGLDSLFQFPRNEDPMVLESFTRAQGQRAAVAAASGSPPSPPGPVPPAPDAVPAPGRDVPGPAAPGIRPGKISIADSGSTGGKPDAHHRNLGLALGALPMGAGWLTHQRVATGVALGLLQAGGIALSMYASGIQTRQAGDRFGTQDDGEVASGQTWQWVQRVSLSTAIGAYLFSLIAATGD